MEASEGAPMGFTGPLALADDEVVEVPSVVVFSFLKALGSSPVCRFVSTLIAAFGSG